MPKDNRSFFEKLTGSINVDDEEFENIPAAKNSVEKEGGWIEEDNEEGQLTVDMYQTDDELVIQAMVAGVSPDQLNISITRDMVTIKGNRVTSDIPEENYFYNELYWGAFSRTIILPQEIEPEEVQAIEKHGLLTLKLPKIDKEKVQKVKVKSM